MFNLLQEEEHTPEDDHIVVKTPTETRFNVSLEVITLFLLMFFNKGLIEGLEIQGTIKGKK